MKNAYPEYPIGSLEEIEKKLSKNNAEILKKYIDHRAITSGADRLRKIKRHILHLYDVTEKDLDKLKKEDVDIFLVILKKVEDSGKRRAGSDIKGDIKDFLKWQYKDLNMVENIHVGERHGLNPKINENNLITQEDLNKMLRSAESYKDKALLSIEFITGARPQEILGLKWRDVKFEEI